MKILLALLLIGGCSKTPIVPKGGPQPMILPGVRVPYNDIITGGQPSRDDIGAAAAIGVKTVISLRTNSESPSPEETRSWVEGTGMTFVHIPVDGFGGVSRENADKLHAALKEAKIPVLVHCSSGNRVGALFALIARFHDGMTPEEALAEGRRTGVTQPKLEAALRTQLK
jgi:uncharacterized protein (TIGR01244 family)